VLTPVLSPAAEHGNAQLVNKPGCALADDPLDTIHLQTSHARTDMYIILSAKYWSPGAGEHGNAELVNKYGFALADNPFDAVKLDKTSLVGIATKHMGNDVCQQRCTFLSDQR